MAKIKDIAKKMNLSVSTVYKAFNGAADINEETRKNIYKNIDKILTNYRKRYKIGL